MENYWQPFGEAVVIKNIIIKNEVDEKCPILITQANNKHK